MNKPKCFNSFPSPQTQAENDCGRCALESQCSVKHVRRSDASKYLDFIYQRLVFHYDEHPNSDYMRAFAEIIKNHKALQGKIEALSRELADQMSGNYDEAKTNRRLQYNLEVYKKRCTMLASCLETIAEDDDVSDEDMLDGTILAHKWLMRWRQKVKQNAKDTLTKVYHD